MITLFHLLLNHPHILHWFLYHPIIAEHYVREIRGYHPAIRHLLSHPRYCRWFLHYLQSHHRLPGIDLLLGA